ncbi:MAG: hypothetical protein DRJ60_00055 [Thermoprotei archaeon]|nr:MAG: hypothetical protein DRJ60_00055 [Thermoprotei archaeon]
MAVQIRTGFGRPRRLGIIRHTTIYLYEKYLEVYEKASELARAMGISFSELVSIALAEYVKKYYPEVKVNVEAGGLNQIQFLKEKLKEHELADLIYRIEGKLKIREKHEKGTLFWAEANAEARKLLKQAINLASKMINPPKHLMKKLIKLQTQILAL